MQPVFNSQSRHAPKLSLIVGDQNGLDGEGMSGDEQIIGADNGSPAFELCPDLPVMDIDRAIQWQDRHAVQNGFQLSR